MSNSYFDQNKINYQVIQMDVKVAEALTWGKDACHSVQSNSKTMREFQINNYMYIRIEDHETFKKAYLRIHAEIKS